MFKVQEPDPTIQQQQQQTTITGSDDDNINEPRTYKCDSIVYDSHFHIESPHYPAMYPINRICSYYIARNRQDVCQVKNILFFYYSKKSV